MLKNLKRTRIYLIAFCVFLFTVNITLGFILTKQSEAALRTLIENRMLDVSKTAAAMLDGDALAAVQADDIDTPEYQSILKTLTIYQENINLKYIYCIRDLGNKNFIFTIDPSDDPGDFGEPIAYTDALYQASLGTPAVDKEPYQDRWGRFYSAYTPVFTSDHQVAGIVAVDFSAEWYESEISQQSRTTILVSAISIFIAGAMMVLVMTRYETRFRFVIDEMNSVSENISTLIREVSPGADTSLLTENAELSSDDGITALGNQIRTLEDQLSRQIAYVRSQAVIDGLTGLGNRAAYEDHVKQLDDMIKEGKADFAVALFDLNGLKELNDKYGHEKGDEAIKLVAAALKQVFDNAKLYRIGGDEFIAVAEPSDAAIPSRFRLVDRILEKSSMLSVSKGYSAFEPELDMGYRGVFNRADYNMYNDKKEYYKHHADRRKM